MNWVNDKRHFERWLCLPSVLHGRLPAVGHSLEWHWRMIKWRKIKNVREHECIEINHYDKKKRHTTIIMTNKKPDKLGLLMTGLCNATDHFLFQSLFILYINPVCYWLFKEIAVLSSAQNYWFHIQHNSRCYTIKTIMVFFFFFLVRYILQCAHANMYTSSNSNSQFWLTLHLILYPTQLLWIGYLNWLWPMDHYCPKVSTWGRVRREVKKIVIHHWIKNKLIQNKYI